MNSPNLRHHHRNRIAASIVLTGLAGLCLSLLFLWRLGVSSPENTASTESAASDSFRMPQWDRPSRAPVYPYSVVAGGVFDREALHSAVSEDAVLAKHYEDFDVRAAHVIQLEAPRFVYVSYRRGNQIFWTRNKVKIPSGESLLSDGHSLARTRCGNRLSEEPRFPTSPTEPTHDVMDDPVSQQPPVIYQPEPSFIAELTPEETGDPDIPPSHFLPPVADPPLSGPPILSAGDPRPIFDPWLPPLFGPYAGQHAPPFTPSAVPTPEPASFVLLLAGLFCLALFGKR
jgi:hypothetical protein